jgi:uncharacterized protein
MSAYQTPGVYAVEISTLPPSVAEVSTAIPAFIGYTNSIINGGKTIARITTMLEYETLFGPPPSAKYTITAQEIVIPPREAGRGNGSKRGDSEVVELVKTYEAVGITRELSTPQFLMYYSLMMYFSNGGGACYIVSIGNYGPGVTVDDFEDGLLELEKEDEPTLIVMPDAVNLGAVDCAAVYKKALTQCATLGDRFVIMDVVSLEKEETDTEAETLRKSIKAFRDEIGMNDLKYGAAYTPYVKTTLSIYYVDAQIKITGMKEETTLDAHKTLSTAFYSQVKALLSQERVTLPPSAAVAGVYARVDRDRGVWKAPANVSLASVIGPVTKITQEAQEHLNVDATSGKSINAIRAFTGKGTLVWGARTLAGNDNEWRYVSVRRLFNMIEESTLKATSFAVFEPNDAATWLKVKAMIESYLYGLWEQGALAGPTPAAAYFVSIGLGKTMTTQDILEGRMIVKIGVAAVRPSEFIILQFSHKLQEA